MCMLVSYVAPCHKWAAGTDHVQCINLRAHSCHGQLGLQIQCRTGLLSAGRGALHIKRVIKCPAVSMCTYVTETKRTTVTHKDNNISHLHIHLIYIHVYMPDNMGFYHKVFLLDTCCKNNFLCQQYKCVSHY